MLRARLTARSCRDGGRSRALAAFACSSRASPVAVQLPAASPAYVQPRSLQPPQPPQPPQPQAPAPPVARRPLVVTRRGAAPPPAAVRTPQGPAPAVSRRGALPPGGPDGVAFLVDKPPSWTSFDVCAKLRGALRYSVLGRAAKVGHAGTLDPAATGLLVVCAGWATRWVDTYQAQAKCYSGVLRLGEGTASHDADTPVEAASPWEHLSDDALRAAAVALMAVELQTPPMYSALRVGGERLYDKARRGEEVARAPRPVTVTRFDVWRDVPEEGQDVRFEIDCSKGTYVRSLAADLGSALGTHAHLTSLRREAIGALSVADAWDLDDLVEALKQQQRAPLAGG